jgi:hypothetical protein
MRSHGGDMRMVIPPFVKEIFQKNETPALAQKEKRTDFSVRLFAIVAMFVRTWLIFSVRL